MSRKGRYKKVCISDLECPACGQVIPIVRPAVKSRPPGQIKTMFCPKCGDEHDFVEYGFYGKGVFNDLRAQVLA